MPNCRHPFIKGVPITGDVSGGQQLCSSEPFACTFLIENCGCTRYASVSRSRGDTEALKKKKGCFSILKQREKCYTHLNTLSDYRRRIFGAKCRWTELTRRSIFETIAQETGERTQHEFQRHSTNVPKQRGSIFFSFALCSLCS